MCPQIYDPIANETLAARTEELPRDVFTSSRGSVHLTQNNVDMSTGEIKWNTLAPSSEVQRVSQGAVATINLDNYDWQNDPYGQAIGYKPSDWGYEDPVPEKVSQSPQWSGIQETGDAFVSYVPDSPIAIQPSMPSQVSDIKIGAGAVKVGRWTDLFNWQNWYSLNDSFAQGEKGILVLEFKVVPDFAKGIVNYVSGWTLETLDSTLKSKGVTLWKPSSWDGSNVSIHFQTGIAPLVILAIAAGVVALAGAIWLVMQAVTAYKVQTEAAKAEDARRKALQDKQLEVIDNIKDPIEQAAALSKMAATEWKDAPYGTSTQVTGDEDKTKMYVTIGILGLAALAVIFFVVKK
jgi:hypothetical protein